MDHGIASAFSVNIAASIVLVAAAVGVLVMRRRVAQRAALSFFLGLTGTAWAILFAAEEAVERQAITGAVDVAAAMTFTLLLTGASTALVLVSVRYIQTPRFAWTAAFVAAAATISIFIGRGASATVASSDWLAVAARAARDTGVGAFVFALVLFALNAPRATSPHKRRVFVFASCALLVYPGVVAGIYLHPDSHRNMAGLAAALLLISALWIVNTNTSEKEVSRAALIVAWLSLALPLLALAAVRWQGGIDMADDGPLRAVARSGGPLLFALALLPRGQAPAAGPEQGPRAGGPR